MSTGSRFKMEDTLPGSKKYYAHIRRWLSKNAASSARNASLAVFFTLLATGANAGLCIVGQVKEVGTWANPDQNTRGITKAVFGEECRDDRRTVCNGDVCSTTFGVKLVHTAQLWGKCHPTDCYWGKVDGMYTSADWLRFYYDHGFAERTVWGQVWSGSDDWLRLIVDTDFVSPSRNDYRFDAWMRRN